MQHRENAAHGRRRATPAKRHKAEPARRHKAAPQLRAATPAPRAKAVHPGGFDRRTALTASAASAGLVCSLMFALPANAAVDTRAADQIDTVASTEPGAVAAERHLQALTVSGSVTSPIGQRDDPVASALAGIVSAQGGEAGAQAGSAIAAALQLGGPRQKILATALTYLGDPYVLDGSTHDGIDCSGLTMVSYAAVGIQLTHLVSAQDVVGTRIPEAQARPGDLVVFDDEEHIGLYLGGGVLIQAPAPGRPVEITTVWQGVAHHFTRILPVGQ